MRKNKKILSVLLSFVMVLSLVPTMGIAAFATNDAPMGWEDDFGDLALLTAPETSDTNSCVFLRLERQPFAAAYIVTSVDFYRSTVNSYTGQKIASGTAECFPDSGIAPGVYYYYAAVKYAIPGGGTGEFLSEIKKVTVTMGDNMLGIVDNLASLSVPTRAVAGSAIPLQLACSPFMMNECTLTGISFYRNTANNYNGTRLSAGKALSYTDKVSTPGTYYYYAGVEYSITEDATGEFYTDIVTVTMEKGNVAVVAPVITTQPVSVTAKPGDTVTFKVGAKGDNLHYKWWYVDAGVPMAFDTDSPTISIKTEDMSWSGFSFWCVVSNTAGSVTSEQARLTLSNSQPKFPFKDVSENKWYYGAVKTANNLGLISGKTATSFCPNDNMTYAEAIKLAACMHQVYHEGAVTLENGSPNWYDSYVAYAKANGIPWNYPNYNAQITREAYVHIFYAALPENNYVKINDVTVLPDVDLETAIGKEILAFYNAGILTGNDNIGTFAPKNSILRCEVAAILSRMMDSAARKTFTLAPFGVE